MGKFTIKFQMDNKKEIIWNIVNSLLAGGLVLFGAFSDGNISPKGFLLAFFAACVVAITQFKDYWSSEKSEYCPKPKVFGFIKI
jgi:hypothetical protein